MKIVHLLWAVLLVLPTLALAQTPVFTLPTPTLSANASGTIASAGTFQQIFPKATNNNRRSCTVQNNGSNTMWVFFGPIASATHNNSVVLAGGASVLCAANGMVLQDQVSIDGTTSDPYFAAQQ